MAMVLGFGFVLTFGLHMLLSRFLGKADYGRFVFVLTSFNIIAVFCRFGGPTCLAYFIPKYREDDQPEVGFKVTKWFIFLSTLLTIVAVLILAATVFLGAWGPYGTFAKWMLPCLPLMIFPMIFGGALKGWKHYAAAQIPEVICKPLLALAVLLTLIFLAFSPFVSAIAAFTAGCVVSFFLAMFLLVRVHLATVHKAQAATQSAVWGKVAVPIVASQFVGLLSRRVDVLILGLLLSPGELGLYAVVIRISTLIEFSNAVANSIADPLISQYKARNNTEGLQGLLAQSSLFSFALGCGIVIFIFIFLHWICFAFKVPREDVWLPLCFVALGQLVLSSAGPFKTVLAMTGLQNLEFKLSLAFFFVTLVFGTLGAVTGGLVGASIAVGSILILRVIVYHTVIKMKLHISIVPFRQWLGAFS